MTLNAGDLDREIVLLTASLAQDDGTGEDVITWPAVTAVEDAAGVDDASVVWAQWLPAGTREAWQAQQRLGSYVDGVFKMRDVSPRPTPAGTRILFESTYYDVKGVVEIGRGDGLLVTVTARNE